MKMAMWLDYKPTRYEGKGFLRNLNTRLHRDITGEMWFVGGVFFSDLFINKVKQFICQFSIKLLQYLVLL
jgi:uncharacterized membrane protein